MQNSALFLGMIEQPCMIARLTDELREAFREFRENPMAFVTTALKRDVIGGRRKMLLELGLAIAILFYALAFVTMLVFLTLGQHRAHGPDSDRLPTILLKVPGCFPKIEIPNGDDKPSGGGGGGNQTNTPPSSGSLPIASLDQLVMAPKPEPQLTPPVLPVTERVLVDPRIQLNHDDLSPTGLPDGVGLTPSAGPGSDRGIGTGPGGGMGPGSGPGVGPGVGGNTGDGTYTIGGATRKPAVQQVVVDERPVLLNRPRPMFTEEARRNKIQGVVRMKVFIDVSGKVAQAVVTRGLPDGLDQQSVTFQVMIHKIHTGEGLAESGQSFTIVGFGGTHNDFSEVRYPAMTPTGSVGDTAKCYMCHVNNSETIFPIGKNNVTDPQGRISPVAATTSACTGCHLKLSALSHAVSQTDPKFGESCDVCHAQGNGFDVIKEHAGR
jgi:hypothetical protein